MGGGWGGGGGGGGLRASSHLSHLATRSQFGDPRVVSELVRGLATPDAIDCCATRGVADAFSQRVTLRMACMRGAASGYISLVSDACIYTIRCQPGAVSEARVPYDERRADHTEGRTEGRTEPRRGLPFLTLRSVRSIRIAMASPHAPTISRLHRRVLTAPTLDPCLRRLSAPDQNCFSAQPPSTSITWP